MRRFFARLTIWIALVLSAVLTALVAVGYFMFALYLLLAQYLGPPAAALISGVIVLFTAVVFALIAGAMFGRLARSGRDSVLGGAEAAADIGSLFGERVHDFAQSHRGSSMLAALIAGFAVGLSPKLRALLWRILKG
jgi:hypothetical protein